MEQLPKIVRDRLNSQAADQHPDADLLTAFVEHRLRGRERGPILQHIAQCTECRRVLSLAIPEPAPGMLAPAVPASIAAPRWRYPWLVRWGALAASLALVGAAGVLFYGGKAHRSSSIEMASAERKAASSDLTPETQSKSQAPVETPLAQPSRKSQPRGLQSRPASRRTKQEAKPWLSREGAKDLQRVPAEADLFVDSAQVANPSRVGKGLNSVQSAEAQAPSPASGPSPSAVEPSKSAHSADTVSVQAVQVEVAASSVPAQNGATQPMKTRKATQPSRLQSANAQMGNTAFTETSALVHGPTLMRDWVVPQWTLSDDGLPERSFDSGKSWEKVQVDHTTGFRALSAHGLDVWVGGPAGALYHSTDFGLHWTRVAVLDGDLLTSEILRIDFSDALHGTLNTSAHQIWTTSDAGKTWQRH